MVGDMNGLQIGTHELVRWGVAAGDADRLASFIKEGLMGKLIASKFQNSAKI
jgi:glycine hydroxymethyltransferase